MWSIILFLISPYSFDVRAFFLCVVCICLCFIFRLCWKMFCFDLLFWWWKEKWKYIFKLFLVFLFSVCVSLGKENISFEKNEIEKGKEWGFSYILEILQFLLTKMLFRILLVFFLQIIFHFRCFTRTLTCDETNYIRNALFDWISSD